MLMSGSASCSLRASTHSAFRFTHGPTGSRETAPGFSLGGRGAPQKRLGFLRPQRRGPKRKRFLASASPHPKPQNQQRSEENAPISERPKRKSGRPAAGLALPRAEHGAEPARGGRGQQ